MPYQLIKRTNPGQRFHFSLIVVVVMLSQITAISAQTTDVPWLEEVQKLPPNPPRERLGKMTPILIDDSGKAITTRLASTSTRICAPDLSLTRADVAPASTTSASMKFIFGLPMKPATNLLTGIS